MNQALIVLLACLALPEACIGAEAVQVPQCPSEISGKLVQVQAVRPGWKGLGGSRFVLERATIVTGPPDAQARAELRGDERRLAKNINQTLYSGLDVQNEKWLVCGYGSGADIEQAYRLPDAIVRCRIKVSRNRDSNRNDVAVACE